MEPTDIQIFTQSTFSPPQPPIPGHQSPMEPTDNLSGGHYCSRSRDYGCPDGTFDQQEQEEDLMSSLFMFSDPPSSLWLPRPPAEGFAGLENFGDGQIFVDEMPYIPFGDGQISPLDEGEVPIPAAVAEETNYAAAPAPLVATHGTGPGQSSYNFSTTFDESDDLLLEEEVVQDRMMALQPLLHPQVALDGMSNTTNGGPAARSHADAVPPVVQQGTSTTADELPHPQQQLPLPTNDPEPEAQPSGGYLSLVHEEVHIQQMAPTISPSQPPSPTPLINPGPDDANHAASAPMGSQAESTAAAGCRCFLCTELALWHMRCSTADAQTWTQQPNAPYKSARTLIPAAPRDQEANILSRASTRRRPIKSRGLVPSRLQDGSGNLFGMGIDMIQQFVRHIGKMLIEEKHRSIVWQHFWRSPLKCCRQVTVICQYCYTVMIYTSTIEMLRHLESCVKYIRLQLRASSGASKETQRSSRALQIKEIAENPNGESEPIETDNSNCPTAARVDDTQGTNAVALSPWQLQHLLLTEDREKQIATILSSQPCRPSFYLHPWVQTELSTAFCLDINVVLSQRAARRRYTLQSSNQPMCLSISGRVSEPPACVSVGAGYPARTALTFPVVMVEYISLDEPESWWDLIIQLSDSLCCSSTTKSTDDGFRLKISNKEMYCGWEEVDPARPGVHHAVQRESKKGCKVVHVDSSAAWVHVRENPYKDHAGVLLGTDSKTSGSSYLSVGVYDKDWASAPAGCSYPWQSMHFVLQSLGFREEFARSLVIYALGWVDACNLRLSRPRSRDKGKSIIVEQGDVSSGKRKRKPAPPRSKVWNHFKKVEVEAEGGSMTTKARCNYCPSELKADSASHGTNQLKRHIRSIHPEHAKSL